MADAIEIFTSSASERIEVITSGAQGPQGPAGPAGADAPSTLAALDDANIVSPAAGQILWYPPISEDPAQRWKNKSLSPSDIDAATAAQGALASTAVQPNTTPALTGVIFSDVDYGATVVAPALAGDISVTLPDESGTLALVANTATAAQGALADTSVQPDSAPTFSGLDILGADPSLRIAQSALGGADVAINDTSVKFGDGTYTHILQRQGTLAANATFTLPNATGTLALTSDIPTTFAASAITSGTLNNARINWAAPSAIGSTTAAAGTFTSLAATGLSLAAGTITASAPFDFSQTWNNAAVTFTGLKLNVTNTNSAAGSKVFDFQVGGTSIFSLDRDSILNVPNLFQIKAAGTLLLKSDNLNRLATNSTGVIAYGSLAFDGATELVLLRDSTNTLAQRNGTNAQEFRLYRTVSGTNNVNYERLQFVTGDYCSIRTVAGGTGTGRHLTIGTASGGDLILHTSSNDRWVIGSSTGHISAGADNTYDIGAAAASRPRNIYAGTAIVGPLRMTGTAPASATATGTAGDIRYDGSYVYICSATNTWVRAALATW